MTRLGLKLTRRLILSVAVLALVIVLLTLNIRVGPISIEPLVAWGYGYGGGIVFVPPSPTATPLPTATPAATSSPAPTATPAESPGPSPTVTPVPTPVPTGVTPSPTPAERPLVTEDLVGRVSDLGFALEDIEVRTDDGQLVLWIAEFTHMETPDGVPPESLEVLEVIDAPARPSNLVLIGRAFNVHSDQAEFDPPIELSLTYDPSELPEGVDEADLAIAYYDSQAQAWVFLESVVDTTLHTVTCKVRHLTVFAILGTKAQVPTPTSPVPTLTPAPPFNVWIVIGPILALLALVGLAYYFLVDEYTRRKWMKRLLRRA